MTVWGVELHNKDDCNLARLYCWRWAKLRASLLPLTIILEPVSESLILGGIASWAVSTLFCWSPLAFFFVHCLVWFLLDYLLLLVVQVWVCWFQQYSPPATPSPEGKEEYLYSIFWPRWYTQSAQAWITQFYLQITPRLPFLREHSPDVTTTATEAADIQWHLSTHLSTPKGWKAELA